MKSTYVTPQIKGMATRLVHLYELERETLYRLLRVESYPLSAQERKMADKLADHVISRGIVPEHLVRAQFVVGDSAEYGKLIRMIRFSELFGDKALQRYHKYQESCLTIHYRDWRADMTAFDSAFFKSDFPGMSEHERHKWVVMDPMTGVSDLARYYLSVKYDVPSVVEAVLYGSAVQYVRFEDSYQSILPSDFKAVPMFVCEVNKLKAKLYGPGKET